MLKQRHFSNKFAWCIYVPTWFNFDWNYRLWTIWTYGKDTWGIFKAFLIVNCQRQIP